jgi:hypothetical protein
VETFSHTQTPSVSAKIAWEIFFAIDGDRIGRFDGTGCPSPEIQTRVGMMILDAIQQIQ